MVDRSLGQLPRQADLVLGGPCHDLLHRDRRHEDRIHRRCHRRPTRRGDVVIRLRAVGHRIVDFDLHRLLHVDHGREHDGCRHVFDLAGGHLHDHPAGVIGRHLGDGHLVRVLHKGLGEHDLVCLHHHHLDGGLGVGPGVGPLHFEHLLGLEFDGHRLTLGRHRGPCLGVIAHLDGHGVGLTVGGDPDPRGHLPVRIGRNCRDLHLDGAGIGPHHRHQRTRRPDIRLPCNPGVVSRLSHLGVDHQITRPGWKEHRHSPSGPVPVDLDDRPHDPHLNSVGRHLHDVAVGSGDGQANGAPLDREHGHPDRCCSPNHLSAATVAREHALPRGHGRQIDGPATARPLLSGDIGRHRGMGIPPGIRLLVDLEDTQLPDDVSVVHVDLVDPVVTHGHRHRKEGVAGDLGVDAEGERGPRTQVDDQTTEERRGTQLTERGGRGDGLLAELGGPPMVDDPDQLRRGGWELRGDRGIGAEHGPVGQPDVEAGAQHRHALAPAGLHQCVQLGQALGGSPVEHALLAVKLGTDVLGAVQADQFVGPEAVAVVDVAGPVGEGETVQQPEARIGTHHAGTEVRRCRFGTRPRLGGCVDLDGRPGGSRHHLGVAVLGYVTVAVGCGDHRSTGRRHPVGRRGVVGARTATPRCE